MFLKKPASLARSLKEDVYFLEDEPDYSEVLNSTNGLSMRKNRPLESVLGCLNIEVTKLLIMACRKAN
jgi:hypothetical protein